MNTRALVVSGGGARGAFAVGAIDYMVKQQNLDFDIVAGTSTGALIAPLVVTGDVDELVRIYTTVTNKDVLDQRFLPFAIAFQDALNSTKPLRRLIESKLTETRTAAILSSSKQMFLTTVNVQTGTPVYYHTGPDPAPNPDTHLIRIENRDELVLAELASASIPVFMPPQVVLKPPVSAQRLDWLNAFGGNVDDQYLDGGIREMAPLRVAIVNGATDVYAILLEPEREDREDRRFKNVLPILERTIRLFSQEVLLNDVRLATRYNRLLLFIEALRAELLRSGLSESDVDALFDRLAPVNPLAGKRLLTLHIIRPETPLDLDGLEFDPAKMRRAMERGRKAAEDHFNRPIEPVV